MKIGRIVVASIALTPLLLTVVAAGTQMQMQAPPVSAGQGDPFYKILLAAFGLAISGIGYFINRQLNQNDANNKRQWEKLDNHESRLSTIEGRCGSYSHAHKTQEVDNG